MHFPFLKYSLESNEVNECEDTEKNDVDMKQCRSNNIFVIVFPIAVICRNKVMYKNVAAV